MELLKLMKERYSVRKFSDRKVEDEKIEAILKAAQLAPTAKDQQPLKILVLKTDAGLEKWTHCTVCHFHEQLVIITCVDKQAVWKRSYDGKESGDVDASIVTTHMMLEAQSRGIGSTWIMYFMPEEVKKEFHLPDHLEPLSALAMGYAAADAVPSELHGKRKDLSELVVYEQF